MDGVRPYSGGIFILEMDKKTGFPLPGQGYGKKLIGGNHSGIEGAYILYHPETQYYYLYMSFGGLPLTAGTTFASPAPKTLTALIMMQKATR